MAKLSYFQRTLVFILKAMDELIENKCIHSLKIDFQYHQPSLILNPALIHFFFNKKKLKLINKSLI